MFDKIKVAGCNEYGQNVAKFYDSNDLRKCMDEFESLGYSALEVRFVR